MCRSEDSAGTGGRGPRECDTRKVRTQEPGDTQRAQRDAQRRAGGRSGRSRGTANPAALHRVLRGCGGAITPRPASGGPCEESAGAFRSGKERSGPPAAAKRPKRHRAAPRVVTFGRGGARRSARGGGAAPAVTPGAGNASAPLLGCGGAELQRDRDPAASAAQAAAPQFPPPRQQHDSPGVCTHIAHAVVFSPRRNTKHSTRAAVRPAHSACPWGCYNGSGDTAPAAPLV